MNGKPPRSLHSTLIPAAALPWMIWGCAAWFFFYQFAIRVSPSVIALDLITELSLTACSLGTIASFYYYGYTGMQIFVGIMLDRIGVRRPLTAAALLCVLGCYLFATADNIPLMSLGRFLMGVGSAFGFLSCMKTASVWFPPQRLGLIIGLSMLIGTSGAVGGGAPLAVLVGQVGWRTSILILGAIGTGIAMLAWMIVRDKKSTHTNAETAKEPELSILESLMVILRNPQTYVYGLFGSCMYVPLAGFADLWGAPYIAQTYDVDRITAAGSVSMLYLGIAAGGPLCAWIITQVESYKKLLMTGSMLTLVMLTIIIYVPLPAYLPLVSLPPYINIPLIDALFFMAGIFASTQFFAFACIVEINSRRVSATASGVHNMTCMISGIVFQPVIGMLLDRTWNGALKDGTPYYSGSDYFFALSVLPISVALACALTFMMREAFPKEIPS